MDSDEETIEEQEEFFYLWADNFDLLKIYKILRQYLGEGYQIDSTILLALIRMQQLKNA